MARDTPNATILEGRDEVEYDYAEAAEALDVGDLAELSGDTVQAHSTAAAEVVQPRVVFESRESGMVARDPAGEYDNYESGELAKYITLDGGEHLLLNLAAGQTVTENDTLVSNGSGKLRAYDSANDAAGAQLFEAKEAVDASGASEFVKVRVEVLA